MKTVAKGINPVNHDIYFSLRYQGFCPIIDGTTFTLQGNLILFFLIPKNEPINTRGVDIHIQRTIRTANSDIVNPSLDCSKEKVILTMKSKNYQQVLEWKIWILLQFRAMISTNMLAAVG